MLGLTDFIGGCYVISDIFAKLLLSLSVVAFMFCACLLVHYLVWKQHAHSVVLYENGEIKATVFSWSERHGLRFKYLLLTPRVRPPTTLNRRNREWIHGVCNMPSSTHSIKKRERLTSSGYMWELQVLLAFCVWLISFKHKNTNYHGQKNCLLKKCDIFLFCVYSCKQMYPLL